MDAGLPDSVYVQAVARLQLIPTPTDSAAQAEADSLRALVLADHGVEPEQLLAFAEVVGREPGRSERIWEQIGAAVDSIREADGLGPEVFETGSAASGPTGDGRDDSATTDDSADEPRTPGQKPQLVPGARRDRPVAGQPIRSAP